MKGFVPTPESVVDLMVEKLFAGREPTAASSVLDPGCGRGEFIAGILRWCRHHRQVVPRIVGVESDPMHAMHSAGRFAQVPQVEIRQEDYLRATGLELHDYIVGNPPYVPITGLSVEERQFYRGLFETATGRFDLYQLFFERALSQLRPGGRLVFVTPEKYLYTESASELRRLLSGHHIHELHFLPERTFEPLVTYPLVTTVSARQPDEPTRIIRRDGRQSSVTLPAAASSWQGRLGEWRVTRDGSTLADACLRISCGVATGADDVFVHKVRDLPADLLPFAHPTIAGRDISGTSLPSLTSSILVPYDQRGALLSEAELGALGDFLRHGPRRSRLLARTCVSRKPWYAFHETPPLPLLRRPKLLCKDITRRPWFVIDDAGDVVPRHSVYYLVPLHADRLQSLAEYLNSDASRVWLEAHCQRAANGFLRLQSQVLKRLPIPEELGGAIGAPVDAQLALQPG